jgi:DNA (cytosine-5)-methyltransferase 1
MMRNGALWERITSPLLTEETESGLSENWPTPQARDYKGSSGRSLKGLELDLPTKVKMWATPCASDNRDRGNLGSGAIQRRKEKGKQIMLSQSVSDTSGALNPIWVEWLMGWPLGWTDCAVSATAKFQRWLNSHGKH